MVEREQFLSLGWQPTPKTRRRVSHPSEPTRFEDRYDGFDHGPSYHFDRIWRSEEGKEVVIPYYWDHLSPEELFDRLNGATAPHDRTLLEAMCLTAREELGLAMQRGYVRFEVGGIMEFGALYSGTHLYLIGWERFGQEAGLLYRLNRANLCERMPAEVLAQVEEIAASTAGGMEVYTSPAQAQAALARRRRAEAGEPEAPAPPPQEEPTPHVPLHAVAMGRYNRAEVVGQGYVTGEATSQGGQTAHLAEDDLLIVRVFSRSGKAHGVWVQQLVEGVMEALSTEEIREFIAEGLLPADCAD